MLETQLRLFLYRYMPFNGEVVSCDDNKFSIIRLIDLSQNTATLHIDGYNLDGDGGIALRMPSKAEHAGITVAAIIPLDTNV